MTTVAKRSFNSTPGRDAASTWSAIVDLLTTKNTAAKSELMAVAGIAASIISDQCPKDAAIVVTCDGPRTRIYCLYDEDAIDSGNANEGPLGYDALKGNWAISLPCGADDLDWVQRALKSHGTRITARDQVETVTSESAASANTQALVIDPKAFLE